MFDTAPRESESRSWLWVGASAALILATVPLARTLQSFITERWGAGSIGVFVIAAVVAAAGAVGLRRRHRPEAGAFRGLTWLSAVTLCFVAYTIVLWKNAEEAFHFIEYGLLSALLYRALTHRLRDASIFVLAALLGTLVGFVDEGLQWLVPGRYWGLRDVWIDLVACSLLQIGIAQGIRPGLIERRFRARGLGYSFRAASACVAILILCAVNTPQRVEAYAARLGAVGFLAGNPSVMFEYGTSYQVPGIGRFRSRFAADELRAQDRARADEVAAMLDAFGGEERYPEFLRIYTSARDPFAHEARVHVFRRNRYWALAQAQEHDEPERRKLLTVVAREDRILSRYFGRTLAASRQALAKEQRALVEAAELPDFEYESTVSRHLVTALSEAALLSALACLLVVGIVLERVMARRMSRVGRIA